MGNKSDRFLRMTCYRYAPEQFQAWQMGSNGKWGEIDLTCDERSTCGNALICRGQEAGLAELKKVLRARQKTQTRYKMGFYAVNSNDFVHLQGGRTFGENDTAGAYEAYRELKDDMQRTGWRVATSESAQLDGAGKPIPGTHKQGYLEINPKQPVFIRVI